MGLGLAFVDVRLVDLSPALILFIFLPPLLFEAAWNLKWSNLKQDLVPISIYAIFGVVISVAGITLGLNLWLGVSLSIDLRDLSNYRKSRRFWGNWGRNDGANFR